MKCRNVTFILMLGVIMLFSMCKKEEVNSPADPGVNGNSARLVSFSPESGAIDDTVIITGENFTGDLDNVKVFFGNTQTKVTSVIVTNTNNVKKIVIRALVPETADITSKINVKVDGLWLVAEEYFTETSPAIQFSGFSPANGYIGDTITLTGAFTKNTPVVKFGDVAARLISQDSKMLKVIVPYNIMDATPAISVAVLAQTIKSTTSFHLNAPVIDSISPKTAYQGQVIRIKGKGFRNISTISQVYLDNSLMTTGVTPESNTSIAVNTKNAGPGLHSIAVEVAGLKTVAKDPVNLIAPIAPVITSIQDTVIQGNLIIIKGQHLLSPSPEVPTTVTTVDQDGSIKKFDISYNSDNQIVVWVPRLSNNGGKYKLTVTVLVSSVTFNTPVTYFDRP